MAEDLNGTISGLVMRDEVGTQDPENLDEELKPLVTVWSLRCRFVCSASRYTPLLTSSPPPEGRQEVGGEG